MIDIRGPDKETIKKVYETGNYTFKKLSDEFGISLGTIKSWAKRDKDSGQPWVKNKSKKVATKNKRVATKSKVKNINKEPIVEEISSVLENTQLTDKQRLFCIYYIKCFNATKAYKKAYGCSYETALVAGPRLLGNVRVQEEIKTLKEGRLNRAMLEPEDIFQKFMDIAFADMNDYVTFGRKEIEVDKDEEGNPVTLEVNYVDFKNSNEVDGTLISEVSQGKNGVSVKLQDRMKAMKWLADHMDLATEEQKARIEVLRSKIVNNEKSKEDKIDEYFEKLEEGIKSAK